MSNSWGITPPIRVDDLRFRYRGMSHDALALQRLEIDQPGLVAVTGPSGAGKSTLLELLAGTLNEPYSGSVHVLGKEWSELRGDRARQFHLRRIGLIPQDLGLLPHQTPRQMLRRALLDADVPERECEGRIAGALSQMDLDGLADRRIAEMSGGQKQRVAIARALVRNVELILADEPTANLNVQLSDETIAVLTRIGQTIPVVIVTHDPRVAQLCSRQIHLEPPTAWAATRVGPLVASRTAPVLATPTGVPILQASGVPAPALPRTLTPRTLTPRTLTPRTLTPTLPALPRTPASRPLPALPRTPAAPVTAPDRMDAVRIPAGRRWAFSGAAAAAVVAVAALGLAGPLSQTASHAPVPQAIQSPRSAVAAVAPAPPPPASAPVAVAAPAAPGPPNPAASPPPVAAKKVAKAPAKSSPPAPQAAPAAAQPQPTPPPVVVPPTVVPAAIPAPAPFPGSLEWWLALSQLLTPTTGTNPPRPAAGPAPTVTPPTSFATLP